MSDINLQVLTLYLNWRIALPFIRLSWCHYPSVGNFRSDGNPRVNRGAALQLSAETTAYLVSMAMTPLVLVPGYK